MSSLVSSVVCGFTRFECSFSDEFFLLRFDRAAVQAALSVLATDGNVEGVDEDGIEAAFEPVLQDGVRLGEVFWEICDPHYKNSNFLFSWIPSF